MFSSSEINTRVRNKKIIPPPTMPLPTESSNPRPTQTDEKRVSKYPVPPNHARNAASDGGLNGETVLPRAAGLASGECDPAAPCATDAFPAETGCTVGTLCPGKGGRCSR